MTRWLVTGSSGHLGDALVRVLRESGDDVVGFDRVPSATTAVVAALADAAALERAMRGADHVLHTAGLHQPHLRTRTRADFVVTNVLGTQAVLDAASAVAVSSVVVTSTTSAFGRALSSAPGEPTAWITEEVPPRVRNVYGATKVAAEDLAELSAGDGLPAVVLRTSRFFPEPDDDDAAVRAAWVDANLKVVEFLHRRVDLADVVDAHLLAARRAPALGFGRYVVSATTPFTRDDAVRLGRDAAGLIAERFPDAVRRMADVGWQLPARLDRVYDNSAARLDLGWTPRHGVVEVLDRALADGDWRSPLARAVGAKGYGTDAESG